MFIFSIDEYTRITTPRQDVLFKKGYLSKPKKYSISYETTTTTTSSSGAMSVVSTEDSTTPSTQSLSPENFTNSTPELPDSEFNPFMYSPYVDQNGLFYVNRKYVFNKFENILKLCILLFTAYMSNGIDPYGGQMFLMPYPSANCQMPPFNPYEYYDAAQDEDLLTKEEDEENANEVIPTQENDIEIVVNDKEENTSIQIQPEDIQSTPVTATENETTLTSNVVADEISVNNDDQPKLIDNESYETQLSNNLNEV